MTALGIAVVLAILALGVAVVIAALLTVSPERDTLGWTVLSRAVAVWAALTVACLLAALVAAVAGAAS